MRRAAPRVKWDLLPPPSATMNSADHDAVVEGLDGEQERHTLSCALTADSAGSGGY
ncbi:MAG: hypothetical protein ACT4NY_28070 [Pseudonocardiales bacterium]